MTADTILHRLIENGRIRPNEPAYLVKKDDVWVATNWREYINQVRQAARALIALGLEAGGKVCIMGFNRPEWVIFDLASMMAGGLTAGIYASNSPSEVHYIIEHSEASLVLLENEAQWKKVHQVRAQLAGLKHVVMMKGSHIDDPLVLDWESFISSGEEIDEKIVDKRLDGLRMDQLATLIYTSGTTGPPKSVMLSHNSLTWTAEQGMKLFNITSSDSAISYLPMSHAAEQMFTIYTPITAGYRVYFAQYPPQKHLVDNFKEVSPTIVFSVPRIWEKFAEGVKATMAEYTGVKARLAAWAQSVGKQVFELRNRGKEPAGLLALQYMLAKKLVYSKAKQGLGLSGVKHCLTGAAPIAPEIVEFFNHLDIPLLEVYGQSEDCGPSTINRYGANRIGTVGQPWPGVQVKLADDGEILVKGPNVFMGYYKDPAATASDLVDGWLHTGDLGRFDEDGYLTIIGRKKEIIITSGGKNIAPMNIEAALKNLSLVSQAVVIGEKRRFITALVTLDGEAVAKFVQEHSLECHEYHTHPTIIEAVQTGIDEEVNSIFARVEHVRGFCILHRDFTIEDGELTPTLKIKRRVVNDHFAEEIDSMYC